MEGITDMMIRFMLSLVIVAMSLGMAAVEVVGAEQISAEEQKTLDAVLDKWSEAFNSHDAEALSRHYTEDVLMILPDGTKLQGRAAVRKFFVRLFSEHPNVKNSGSDVTHRKLAQGVILEDGIWEESEHSSEINWTRGRYMVILVQRNEKWLVSHERDWVLVEEAPPAK
jgi:uncharacterized protein (TIGR02246 family)